MSLDLKGESEVILGLKARNDKKAALAFLPQPVELCECRLVRGVNFLTKPSRHPAELIEQCSVFTHTHTQCNVFSPLSLRLIKTCCSAFLPQLEHKF